MKSVAASHCDFDQFGFIWIATNDGLVRFNGKEVTTYYRHSHPGLTDDQIGHVFCDRQNRIWVSTNFGLTRVTENRQFFLEIIDPEKPMVDVQFVAEDGNGLIYALTTRGTYSRNSDGSGWIKQSWVDSLFRVGIAKDLRRFDKDSYTVVTPSGVMLIDLTHKKLVAFFPYEGLQCAAKFTQGQIVMGGSTGFKLFIASIDYPDNIKEIPRPANFEENNLYEQIMNLTTGSDGRIYMSLTGKGMLVLDSTLTKYTNYKHDPNSAASVMSDGLRNIISDSLGNVVLSSLDGVDYTNIKNPAIEYINYFKDAEGNINDQRVLSIAEDSDQNLWIAIRDKLIFYNPQLNTSKGLKVPPQYLEHSESFFPMWVEIVKKDEVWVGLRREGIAIFKHGIFSKLLHQNDFPPYPVTISNTRVIKRSDDGYVYVGTEDGLCRFTIDDHRRDTFPDDTLLRQLDSHRIIDMVPLKDEIWISSSPHGAVWHYHFKTKTLKKYNFNNGLSSNRPYGLTGPDQGNMYIGGYNSFSVIDQRDSIINYTKGNGIIGSRVESIELALDGSVWMTNNYNILKYLPAEKKLYKIDARQGLTNLNFPIMASTILASGKIVFGANRGLVILDPKTITFNQDTLHLFVFYLNANGNEIQIKPESRLNFSYKNQHLRFAFAVSDLTMADQVTYRYRMNSGERIEWSAPSTISTVDFNLNPGKYSFEVEVFDGSFWHPFAAPIQIRIHPPWWAEWYVIMLLICMAIGTVWWYYKTRFDKLKNDLLVERQIAQLESKALQSQMNPHFVFNSLNAIQECIVTGKVEEAYGYLSKFSKLLRLVLEQSDMTDVSLQEELEVLNLYISLEKLRFKDDMTYQFEIDEDLDPEEIRIPPMLIQPHLENAIWHGLRHKTGEKQLRLFIREQPENYLEVIIEDDGIGRIRAGELRDSRLGGKSHKSKGKQLSENRLELLKNTHPLADLTIHDLYKGDHQPAGTRVILVIPIYNRKFITPKSTST